MIQIDSRSPVPINDQIKAALRGLVAKGLLRPGDQAPSIRSLAERLKVNPNTVARAFRELSLEGLLETRKGEGNYVASQAVRFAKSGFGPLSQGLREALGLARRGGLGWEEIESVVAKAREEES